MGFREPKYPVYVCGKSAPWQFAPPQTGTQAGMTEISKEALKRNQHPELKCLKMFCFANCASASTDNLPEALVGTVHSIKSRGFHLHNHSTPVETRNTVFGKYEPCHGCHCSCSVKILEEKAKPWR